MSRVNQLYTQHPTVSLPETWFSENIDRSHAFPGSDYIVANRSDRGEGKHGGFLLAVQSGVYDLYSSLDLSMSNIDFGCAYAVNLLIICYHSITLYIAPRGSAYILESVNALEFISTTISQFRNLIMNSCSNRTEIVVCGDFNAPEVDWSSFCSPLDTSQMLIDDMDQLDLFQCITKPTHKKRNMFDLCF